MKPKGLVKNLLGNSLTLTLSTVLAIGMLPHAAQASTLSWDADAIFNNGTLGGTGTWNTSLLNWDDGAQDTSWATNTITGDTALFAGTAGTVTLGSSINALGLQFTTTGYTIALGGNTLSLGTGGINASALASGTTTISGLGTLAVGDSQAWNVGTGSTLAVSSKVSIDSGSTLSKSGSGTLALSGSLTGSGTLTLGAGTTSFTTTNRNTSNAGLYNGFTGTINVGSGTTLAFNSPNSANGADYYYNLSNAAVAFTGGTTQWNAANGSGTNDPGVAYINFGSISGTGTLAGSAGGTGGTKGARYVVGTLNTDTTFSGVIAASSAGTNLVKVGTGTLILSGTNTYAGTTLGTFSQPATTIRGGTLQVGDGTSGSLASTGALNFSDTGKFNYQGQTAGSSQSLGALSFSQGSGTVQSTYGTSGNTSLTFSNVIARTAGATANFVVSGGANGSTNKIVFTQVGGATPTTGALLDKGYYFNGADFAAYDAGGFVRALAYGTDTNTSAVDTIGSGTHVKLTSSPAAQSSTSLLTLNLAGSGVSWANDASQTLTLSAGGLIKSGGGSTATISGGTGLTTGGATELVVRTDTASDSLDIQTAILNTTTGGLTKSGAGTLTLSGTGNAWTGNTNLNEGTTSLTGSYSGSSSIRVNNSATLNVSGSLTATGTMIVGNGSGNGVVNVNSGSTVTLGTTGGTNGLVISNSGTGYDTATGVVNVNGGTLTSLGDIYVGLGGTQTGKLVINSGTVNVGTTTEKWMQVGSWDTSGGQIDLNGGTLNLNTNTDIRFGTNGGGGISVINQNGGNVVSYSNNGTTLGGTTVLDMQFAAGSGTANNTYNLNGGTLAISQVTSTQTTGTRTFNFNGGTLKVAASNGTFFSGTAVSRANVRNGGAIIDTNGINSTIAASLVHSNIVGDNAIDGGLTKSGTGTLTLGGVNTYTGATTISGGTLALGAAGSIDNTSGVSLGTGGTFDVSSKSGYTVNNLSGSGTVTGALTVSTQLAIGNSPGTVNFTGDLTLGSGSTYLYEMVGGGTQADLGDVAGNLTLSGSILDLVQLGTYTDGDKFTLFAYDGTLTGTFNGLADDDSLFTDGGGEWLINYNDTTAGLNGGTGTSYVTITAVPEPGAALLGGLGLLALLRRRRVA